MANPAGIADLEARWRPLSGNEIANGEALLADAWSYLHDDVPSLDASIESGAVQVSTVIAVMSSMVLRVLRNPDGKVQEALDDYSYRRADGLAGGFLYATEEELNRLRPSLRRAGGAFSIRPGGYES